MLDTLLHSVAVPCRRSLSDLETEVLAHVASGRTNEEIAKRLRYSGSYIKDVVMSARGELGAYDRAHAAALAVALGLIRAVPTDEVHFVPTTEDQRPAAFAL